MAASNHYFPASNKGEAHGTNHTSVPVSTASGAIMRSVASDRFPLAGVPPAARECTKFREIALPLISVGKLCVHGMIVAFDARRVNIFNQQEELIKKGPQDPIRNLYQIPIETSEPPRVESSVPRQTAQLTERYAANVYEVRAVPALISYLHGCAGFIPKST